MTGPDPEVMAEFLEQLVGIVDAGALQLSYLAGSQMRTEWFQPGDVASMVAAAATHDDAVGIYVPVATRRERLPSGRGGVDDCAELLALVADLDVEGAGHVSIVGRPPHPPTMTHAIEMLDGFPLPPTVVVDTGGGLQCWWFLDEPTPVDEALEVAQRWAVTWPEIGRRHGWHVDNVGDVARVMRLPGTVNRKTSMPTPKPVVIVSADWSRRYSLSELDEATIEPTPTERPPASTSKRLSTTTSESPIDWYLSTHDVAAELQALGAVFSHASRDGRTHWFAPHRASSREQTGVTVYPDGEAVIWSSTFAAQLGVADRASLDAFSLYRIREHAGNEQAAVATAGALMRAERPAVHAAVVATDTAVAGREPVDERLVEWHRNHVVIGADGYRYSDLGNAERLIALHGEHLRFVPAWKQWLVYDGGRWRLDHADTLAAHLAAALGRHLIKYVEKVYRDEDEMKGLRRWVVRCESVNGVAATLKAASSRPGTAIDHEALDADPWLLNVRNGTIDLRTGQLRPHNPADLLMHQAATEYHPGAVAPQWRTFLERVQPDDEVRGLIQRLAGLALVGQQLAHVMVVCIGNGANGKSTATRVLAEVLGDYAVVANRDLLLALKANTHPTQKASLFRRRFAHLGELPHGARLDEAQVKELSGDDRITARRMYENEWQFDSSHLLWLHANHRPLIEGTDDGIWRRLMLIPFDVAIPEAERDPGLARRIVAEESAGVLAWALEGLADYLANGLRPPSSVKAATDSYRHESDTVALCMEETGLILDPSGHVVAGELLQAHNEWFHTSGVTGSEQAHYQKLTAHLVALGVTKSRSRTKGGLHWRGARLAAETEARAPVRAENQLSSRLENHGELSNGRARVRAADDEFEF